MFCFYVETPRKSEQTQVYGTAVNLKLLMDMPEKVGIFEQPLKW